MVWCMCLMPIARSKEIGKRLATDFWGVETSSNSWRERSDSIRLWPSTGQCDAPGQSPLSAGKWGHRIELDLPFRQDESKGNFFMVWELPFRL